jgi:hypothetical protein
VLCRLNFGPLLQSDFRPWGNLHVSATLDRRGCSDSASKERNGACENDANSVVVFLRRANSINLQMRCFGANASFDISLRRNKQTCDGFKMNGKAKACYS